MQEFTNTENEKKFIGVWKLDEWSVEKPNGNKTYPFAGDVSGYLMYHADGWMTANLMQKSRKKVSDDRVKISKISHILKNETEISFEGRFVRDNKELLFSFKWLCIICRHIQC